MPLELAAALHIRHAPLSCFRARASRVVWLPSSLHSLFFFKAMAARKVSKAKRVKTQVKRRHASGPEKLPRDKSQKAVYGRGKLPDKALAAPRRVPFAPSAPLPGLLAKLFLALAWWA